MKISLNYIISNNILTIHVEIQKKAAKLINLTYPLGTELNNNSSIFFFFCFSFLNRYPQFLYIGSKMFVNMSLIIYNAY